VRYLHGRAFPPYAFLPGRDPHPTRDPQGHSFAHEEPAPPFLPPERWRESAPYLWGADLYNHGFLWEAHEAWEGLWHVSKPDRIQALFLQGLIQCAAAWLKIAMEQPQGLTRLSALALEKFDQVVHARGAEYMGLDLDAFRPAVRAFAGSSPASPSGRPELVLAERDG
jgi:predicted metal-dependent hydrolase